MSASGFTPNVSDTSVQSVSSATSSSHQPPEKQLKALEEAEEDYASAKQLPDSTDEDNDESVPKTECKVDPAFPGQFVASPVPDVPDDVDKGDDEEEGGHEADDFVPNRQRETTLEPGAFVLHVTPEVFEIGEDTKDDERRNTQQSLHSLTSAAKATAEAKDVPKVESCSATPAFEQEGPQPCTSPTSFLHESSPGASNVFFIRDR